MLKQRSKACSIKFCSEHSTNTILLKQHSKVCSIKFCSKHSIVLKYGFHKKSLRKDAPLADLEKKRRKKVFNWSEVHLSEVTSYKIHTLVLCLLQNLVEQTLDLTGYSSHCDVLTRQRCKQMDPNLKSDWDNKLVNLIWSACLAPVAFCWQKSTQDS